MRRISTIVLLLATACTTAEEVAVTVGDDLGPSARYLALGDSYTIGESVDPFDSWPIQLGRKLEDAGAGFVDVQIIARTGWTTSELITAIDGVDPQGPFDLVSLLIGVNNQFRGADIEEYAGEFAALLDRAIEFTGGNPSRVVVVSIPDWGSTPFGSAYDQTRIAAEIDAFNAVGEERTEAAGARWAEITSISRGSGTGLVAGDGLHPSGAQYTAWVDVILAEALEALTA